MPTLAAALGTEIFAASGAPTPRTAPDRFGEIKNAKDFGAVGDGTLHPLSDYYGSLGAAQAVYSFATSLTNSIDWAGIMAAIKAAAGSGSSTAGNILGGDVYVPPGRYMVNKEVRNDFGGTVRLHGSGKNNCTIRGSVAGFVVNQGDAQAAITVVDGFALINDTGSSGAADPTIGALRFETSACGLVSGCYLSGITGILAADNAFNSVIQAVEITGCEVGGYFGQVSLIGVSAVGNTTCFIVFNSGFTAKGCRTESSIIGTIIGEDKTGSTSTAHGVSISGMSTERCDNAMLVISSSAGEISGLAISGTIGTAKAITTISWSAGGGGVATVTSTKTLDSYGWTSGTRSIEVDSPDATNYSTGGFVTGTRISSTQFTYVKASNPGALSGSPTWSFKIQCGLRVYGANGTVFKGVVSGITNCEVAQIDLFAGGSTSGSNNVMVGCTGSGAGGWLIPTAISKASFTLINCDNPSLAMNFADLPGQAGVYCTPAVQSMTYYINNGNQATIGGNVTAGGGSNVSSVVYDGTNWKRGV